uniref:Uncharacterized protein n=1 Tax=viral metagenome TaxID=1070528 RepID=A0A6C0EL51_9ZZZZ
MGRRTRNKAHKEKIEEEDEYEFDEEFFERDKDEVEYEEFEIIHDTYRRLLEHNRINGNPLCEYLDIEMFQNFFHETLIC